jgi:large subunit ribosomal protein L25
MARTELEVSKREIKGAKVRFLRREGKTPANLYGHGIESIPLQVDTKHLSQTLAQAGKTDLIALKIDGAKSPRNVLVREVQIKPLSGDLLHVDFYQVRMTEKIKADIPLVFIGEAPAMKKKNVSLLYITNSVHVEALPDALPHNLEVDLSKLEDVDQAIYVKDIQVDEKVTLLTDPEQMLAKVEEARREAVVVEEAEEVEEAAEETEEVEKESEPGEEE